jgi:glutathione S-transferase
MSGLTLVSHHLCPYVQRAAIALNERGVAFERVTIDLAQKPHWFTTVSPLGKVPLLQVEQPGRDVAVLFESAAICEFIEETQAGTALHPADAIQRAQHRAWIEFGSSILSDIYAIETTADLSHFKRVQLALTTKFARLEGVLGVGPYFAGEHFSLVDATFAPAYRYFDVFDDIADLGILVGMPKVAAWRSALAVRPSVRAAVAADYSIRLWQFLDSQNSHLRSLMAARGSERLGKAQGTRP